MSDLDHIDPRIDSAFEALTRQFARDHGPGPQAAMVTARRRRRTRVGAVALATLVVVGGSLTVPRLLFPEDGVAANGGSARLDAGALEHATAGWVDGWVDQDQDPSSATGGHGIASCLSIGAPGGDGAPPAVRVGISQFVTPDDALAHLAVERYADAERAASAQERSNPAPDTCGTTTTYDVDGVQVRHDSMPPEQPGIWLGDIWSVRIGDERARLELATGAGNADSGTAEAVAETLVAGLRDGWTQSVEDVEPPPRSLPEWPDIDLEGALAGWESPTRAAPSTTPAIPCLDEQLYVDVEVSASSSSPRGVSSRITGYAEETTGPAKVADMVEQFRTCSRGDVQLETLPNGVHLATYDLGGAEGRGALWFGAFGDRAGFVGVSRADRPMPTGVREDVAEALHAILRVPWE